jgi:hypothetical protein
MRAEREEQARSVRAAFRDADIRPGDPAEVVRTKLTHAAAAHEVPLDGDLSRISRFIAATQARRGTRTARFLAETVSGLRAARRRGPSPAPDSPNGRELRRQHVILARIWAAAAVALWMTRIVRGGPRIAFAVAAGFLSAIGAMFGLITYLMSTLARATTEPPDRPG